MLPLKVSSQGPVGLVPPSLQVVVSAMMRLHQSTLRISCVVCDSAHMKIADNKISSVASCANMMLPKSYLCGAS